MGLSEIPLIYRGISLQSFLKKFKTYIANPSFEGNWCEEGNISSEKMALQFFAPKILGSVIIGAGVLGGGGTIYWYQMPTTWRELLKKEGFLLLSTEDDYKGMFEDQKSDNDWKQEESLKNSIESNVNTNASSYCQGKLDVKLPNPSAEEYASTKRKLIAFCTHNGIKTVKARLIKSKKSGWITEDEKWKTVFAVYRYQDEFIEWLKKDNDSNGDLSKSSKVEEGYLKLKTACTSLLKKDHREIPEDHIKYGSWWCVDLGYTTIKEKIKKGDSSWETKKTDDSDWEQLKEKWKDTEQVKKWANKANNSTNESDDLTETTLKKLCEEANVTSKLSEEDSYQEKYLVIKSVCKSGG